MNCRPYREVVLRTVEFLEVSDHTVIDQDAAVALLEEVAATLRSLSESQKRELLEFFAQQAQLAATPERQSLIANLGEMLGLVS